MRQTWSFLGKEENSDDWLTGKTYRRTANDVGDPHEDFSGWESYTVGLPVCVSTSKEPTKVFRPISYEAGGLTGLAATLIGGSNQDPAEAIGEAVSVMIAQYADKDLTTNFTISSNRPVIVFDEKPTYAASITELEKVNSSFMAGEIVSRFNCYFARNGHTVITDEIPPVKKATVRVGNVNIDDVPGSQHNCDISAFTTAIRVLAYNPENGEKRLIPLMAVLRCDKNAASNTGLGYKRHGHYLYFDESIENGEFLCPRPALADTYNIQLFNRKGSVSKEISINGDNSGWMFAAESDYNVIYTVEQFQTNDGVELFPYVVTPDQGYTIKDIDKYVRLKYYILNQHFKISDLDLLLVRSYGLGEQKGNPWYTYSLGSIDDNSGLRGSNKRMEEHPAIY